MEQHFAITIAREFGSGGKEIGAELARRLQIPCYEQQIVRMAAEANGLEEKEFNKMDYAKRGNFWFSRLLSQPFNYTAEPSNKKFTSDKNLFYMQSQIIRELLQTTSFVILGKCADYVLKDEPHVIRFFVDAPKEICAESIMRKLRVPVDEAMEMVENTNRYRSDYYNYYTGGEWKDPNNYDLMINTGRTGREKALKLMEEYIRDKMCLWDGEEK